MKKEDVDKFRENLNNNIDKIIEKKMNLKKEGKIFKPSRLFLTISIACLVFVFRLS